MLGSGAAAQIAPPGEAALVRAPIGVSKLATKNDRVIRSAKIGLHGNGTTNEVAPTGCLGSDRRVPSLTNARDHHQTLHLKALPNASAVLIFGTPIAPVDLTDLGAPGCQLQVRPLVVIATRTDAAGRALIPVSTLGTSLVQAVVLDATANRAGVTVTAPIFARS